MSGTAQAGRTIGLSIQGRRETRPRINCRAAPSTGKKISREMQNNRIDTNKRSLSIPIHGAGLVLFLFFSSLFWSLHVSPGVLVALATVVRTRTLEALEHA